MILLTYQPENGNSVTFKIVEGHDFLPGYDGLLAQMTHFLRSMGYGVDRLVAEVDVKGVTIKHTSDDE